MYRFIANLITVISKKCRKRLWRSETEMTSSYNDSHSIQLSERQQKREPCICYPNGRIDEYSAMDAGISQLFSNVMEETCFSPDPSSSNHKKKPDRVHGLRCTKKIEALLNSPYVHDEPHHIYRSLLKDIMKTTLQADNGGDLLHFPFLIAEAKRGKGAENFEQIEIQTCFPIKYALQLQSELLKIPGNDIPVPGGPLVWFFANRGEDWRVYAAHIEEREGRPKYIINYLWAGSLTGLSDTLQLLLIVDYIVDWARDKFRPSILRQLEALTNANYDDTTTLADSNVCLNCDKAIKVRQWNDHKNISTETLTQVFQYRWRQRNGHLGKLHGVVRNARRICLQLRGLIISKDNSQAVFQNFETPIAATKFTESVISIRSRRCVALQSEDIVNTVEPVRTGHNRANVHSHDPTMRIFVHFRFSNFIDVAWQQIQELSYLAVTDD
ncbi:hypothetical protein B0J11DRAFT_603540, partial [Dendryphion nanum]